MVGERDRARHGRQRSRCFRWNRKEYKKATGVSVLPALAFEDGTFLREESDDLVARIKEGRLAAD